MTRAARKYLAAHAEPEQRLASLVPGAYEHVVVIPAYGEGEHLHATLASLGTSGTTLAIVIVNARDDAPSWAHVANARLTAQLPGAALETSDGLPRAVFAPTPYGARLVVHRDADGHFLPPGQGVGMARKIGADLALALHMAGKVTSPWLYHTDADTLLPADYLARAASLPMHTAAAVYPFVHDEADDVALRDAAVCYEISLRYYVLGLQYAGSPYAFHTIGSTIVTHADAYAKVRGVPKRNAAEDFYFLDKLRKVGDVARLGGEPLRLSGRVSQRVPFGTGKAIWRLVTAPDAQLQFYDPRIFDYLRAWLATLDALASGDRPVAVACREATVADADLLTRLARDMGAREALEAARRQGHSHAVRRRFLHTWFDAFRTLRFVHTLRDTAYPSLDMSTALRRAPFARISADAPPREVRAMLAQIELRG